MKKLSVFTVTLTVFLTLFSTFYGYGIEFCICFFQDGATQTSYFYSIDGNGCCSSTAVGNGYVTDWLLNEENTWVSVSTETIGTVAAQNACCHHT